MTDTRTKDQRRKPKIDTREPCGDCLHVKCVCEDEDKSGPRCIECERPLDTSGEICSRCADADPYQHQDRGYYDD